MNIIKKTKYLIKKYEGWLIWFISGLFYLYEFMHRVIPGIITKELINDFKTTTTTIGGLSASYHISYSFMQIPAGILIDKYGTKVILPLSAILITLGSYLLSKTNSINIAYISRILIGIGSSFSFIGCIKLASIWLPKKKFPIIVGITNLLGVTGAIIGGRPIATLTECYGWRKVITIMSITGIIFSFLLLIFIKEKKNNTIKEKMNFNKIKNIFTIKKIWIISLYAGLIIVPIASYSELWGMIFITNNYNLEKPIAAQIISLTFIGISIGGPTFGYMSNILKKKNIMILGNIGAIISLTAIINIKNLNLNMLSILHILFGFFTSSMLLSFVINTQEINKSLKGTSTGLTNTIIMSVGVIFQPIIGKLIDTLKNKNLNYNILNNTNYYQISLMPIILCQIIALIIIILIKIKE